MKPDAGPRAYILGLLAPLDGENDWTIAEATGDHTPDKMQRLLNEQLGRRLARLDHLLSRNSDNLWMPSSGMTLRGVRCHGKLGQPVTTAMGCDPPLPIRSALRGGRGAGVTCGATGTELFEDVGNVRREGGLGDVVRAGDLFAGVS